MSQQVVDPSPVPAVPAPHRVWWTRQDCARMAEMGLLAGRYELINGEIVTMMGEKPRHASVIRRLMTWLVAVFGAARVSIEHTMDVSAVSPDYDEPVPDAVVTREGPEAYDDRHPAPPDALLVVEVSDTTLQFELVTKAALYARAGVVEYWVVDIAGRRVVAHRRPSGGGWRDVTAVSEGGQIATLARPDAVLSVAALFPPPARS